MTSPDDIYAAAERLKEVLRPTPVERAHELSTLCRRPVYLKPEHRQVTGSFKIRGAFNRMATLSPAERCRGVVAASAGNHARGVAQAALAFGTSALIVMPEETPQAKLQGLREGGAKTLLAGATYEEAFDRALSLAAEEERVFLHAFDDEAVIAGQGTVGLEILKEAPEVGSVVVPVGGGGLIGGVSLALKVERPDMRVIGVCAAEAPSPALSFRSGERVETSFSHTMADGIAVRRVGEQAFALITQWVDAIVAVDEDTIAQAILTFLEREKTVVEGAGAVGLAALLDGKIPGDDPVLLLVSGGNVDVNLLSRVIERGLVRSGRFARIRVELSDHPGTLGRLGKVLGAARANILHIQHDRTRPDLPVGQTLVELHVEVRGWDHLDQLLERLADEGYRADTV